MSAGVNCREPSEQGQGCQEGLGWSPCGWWRFPEEWPGDGPGKGDILAHGLAVPPPPASQPSLGVLGRAGRPLCRKQ